MHFLFRVFEALRRQKPCKLNIRRKIGHLGILWQILCVQFFWIPFKHNHTRTKHVHHSVFSCLCLHYH